MLGFLLDFFLANILLDYADMFIDLEKTAQIRFVLNTNILKEPFNASLSKFYLIRKRKQLRIKIAVKENATSIIRQNKHAKCSRPNQCG